METRLGPLQGVVRGSGGRAPCDGALGPGSGAGLGRTFCATPGPSLASRRTRGGSCPSAPRTVLLCLPATRGPWQGHLDLHLRWPLSRFLFGRGPQSGPRLSLAGSQGTLSSCLLSVENLRPETGRGQPRVARGQWQRPGSWLRAPPGPCGPHPAPSRAQQGRGGAYSPPRLQGHRFPFHVERKLTACLQEQLGFVPSAVLGACSRLDNPGCVPGDQEPTEAPWPRPRSHGGLRWGPREPLLQGPRFLSAPETEMALPRQRSPGSSGRGAAGCGGSGGGPSFVTGLLVPGGHESRCKQLCGGSPFSRLPRAHPRGFQALPSLCCRRKGGWETASPGGVPAGASGRQKTRQPAPPPCVGRGSPGS